jgi:hypothetical protein
MSSVVISGDTSGAITLAAPAVSGTNTATLPAATGTIVISGQNSAITAGTAVASTSGTSIDFTSIPSWVKRITVMFAAVSTNGVSSLLVQLGDSGGVETTGYVSTGIGTTGGAGGNVTSTAGYIIRGLDAAFSMNGQMVITLLGSNQWCSSQVITSDTTAVQIGGGRKTLSDTLDRVRITTVNGTDTFDAGTINILYE